MGKSKKAKASPAPAKPSPRLLLSRALFAVATGLAGFLAWSATSDSGVPGCGPDSSCDSVLSSKWGYWFGLPVSVLAIPLYAILLAATFPSNSRSPGGDKFLTISKTLASVVVLGGVWFVGVQAVILSQFCPWCCATHAAAIAAAILFLLCSDEILPGKSGGLLSAQVAAPAVGAMLMLVIGQLVSTPPVNEAVTVDAEPVIDIPVIEEEETKRTLSLHAGNFVIDPEAFPMIGSPDAEKLVVSLFDFTCSHCRETHAHLVEGQKRLGDKLGIISVPAPLDTECNVLMQDLKKNTPSAHANACKIAKVALAVWELNPEGYHDFEEELFIGRNCPPLAVVIGMAERFVDRASLAAAIQAPSLSEQLTWNTSLYKANYIAHRKGSLPQLMVGDTVAFGTIKSVDDLFAKLNAGFGPDFTDEGTTVPPGS